ncbi:Hypothetical predicted protein [Lecanosticta acicola]|uniref:Uncharacterized protein n=1 Tax=Lecanosticta acicola TaxID=111012 RepID=A0AAI9EDL8_9PEZI|nr:Hypothetical predicted protein [Lecanosticta acicola]
MQYIVPAFALFAAANALAIPVGPGSDAESSAISQQSDKENDASQKFGPTIAIGGNGGPGGFGAPGGAGGTGITRAGPFRSQDGTHGGTFGFPSGFGSSSGEGGSGGSAFGNQRGVGGQPFDNQPFDDQPFEDQPSEDQPFYGQPFGQREDRDGPNRRQ